MTLAAHLAALITERSLTCPHCKQTDALSIRLMNGGMHYGRIECNACNDAFVTWAPKPNGGRSTPKDGRRKNLLAALRAHYDPEPLYCLICLRDERTFPSHVWLEAHHVLEHQDGGTDNPTNLHALCNECHALVHWRRNTTSGAQAGKEAQEHA